MVTIVGSPRVTGLPLAPTGSVRSPRSTTPSFIRILRSRRVTVFVYCSGRGFHPPARAGAGAGAGVGAGAASAAGAAGGAGGGPAATPCAGATSERARTGTTSSERRIGLLG
jgi:hypothetical protein